MAVSYPNNIDPRPKRRKDKNNPYEIFTTDIDTAQPQESVEDVISQRMEVDTLYHAIAELPEKQHRRLVLYYFAELTYEQIAELEGCTISPIKRSIDAAIGKLKNILK